MKRGFYPKLALTGISKNRKVYVPYLLTCAGMVMMFYIVSFLSVNKSVADMPGGGDMQMILSLGCGVIGVFSLIFLFYTNSFLIRKRKREFGLYNILGMGKWNLARILVWESVFIGLVSLVAGLFCGILFSKIAELSVSHMLGGDIRFGFSVERGSVLQAVVLFAVIFLLILLNALRQIHVANPVELLHSDAVGEKPPKANWIVALLGAVILAGAYYLALTIQNPLAAIFGFFVAVVMVIIATYLLFIAGSVVFCRLLQKNKRYYYTAGHFVSVSSMVYRMKRNGAGLASICILSTMVLVMLSSTVCLYAGAEDSLRTRYPRNIIVDTHSADPTYTGAVESAVDSALRKNGAQPQNILRYRYLETAGYLEEDRMIFDESKLQNSQLGNFSGVGRLFMIPLEDYNRTMGTSETLADNEVLLYCNQLSYPHDSITLEDAGTMKVKKVVTGFVDNGVNSLESISALFVVTPDLTVIDAVSGKLSQIYGGEAPGLRGYYGFDLAGGDEAQTAAGRDISASIRQLQSNDSSFPTVLVQSAAEDRAVFYALYSGLLFLGILLSIVFILGAVLIMYYKQITEGYEDQARFDIMQKVGMTKREIRKSVNSQVLTVFFLPLVTAGIHVIFAFPMISKLLALFSLTNTSLLIAVTAVCYLIFALFYVLVYVFTSRAYYGIVSSTDEA